MASTVIEDIGRQQTELRLDRHIDDSGGFPIRHGLPLWQGQSLQGKGILVYDELSLSAAFLLCRYLFKLIAMGVRIVFETRPELFNLFKNIPLIDETILKHKSIKPEIQCDFAIPLAGLAERLEPHPDTVSENAPYFFADARKTALWSRRMVGRGLKVGLAWGGGLPRRLKPLFLLRGIHWYSLQDSLESGSVSGIHSECLDRLGTELKDFSDIAAAIANLDLMITTDTTLAVLAGAMGKPVWVMLPFATDRPCFPDRKNPPWYPSMRLYRQQTPDDFIRPIAEIEHDLVQWVEHRKRRPAEEIIQEHYDAAVSYHRREAYDQAEKAYRELISWVPDHHISYSALGLLYLNTGRYQASVQTLRKALDLKPDDHLCLNNMGIAFQRLGRIDSAISSFAKAIACRPDYQNAYCNLGNSFIDMNDTASVIHWYAKALAINPDNAQAQCEMGKLYLKNLNTSMALTHFQKAATLDPGYIPARISLATTALMQGDYSVGWDQYRWRFKDEKGLGYTYPGRFNLPQWQGTSFKNKRLIVHCEQGLGDSIQFCRFLPMVKTLGGRVIFQAQTALLPLFKGFPGIDVLQALPARQPESPDADLYSPLLDVPYCLGLTLETIPARTPYIYADPAKVTQWRPRFDARKFAIGMVWSGNPDHFNDHNRSMPLDPLLKLGDLEGVRLYSLQKEMKAEDQKKITLQNQVIALGPDFKDFSDTAAAIAHLDLVISVDTAVAHLAGAMAKPVWVMLPYVPDWRWMLHREDTPWYPTMKLFRQPQAHAWDPVIQNIVQALKVLLYGKRFKKAL